MLSWGKEYLVCAPTYYRIEYEINPYMNVHTQPDLIRAHDEHNLMIAALTDAGANVRVIDQRLDSPDMVYAMNLGFAYRDENNEPKFVPSRMRFEQRRNESLTAQDYLADHGFEIMNLPTDPSLFFEAGDAFAFNSRMFIGYGPRTSHSGAIEFAKILNVQPHLFNIDHPSMYHMDLAFCPIDETTALICMEAFTPQDANRLLGMVPDPIVISVDEALNFAANLVVVNNTVIHPGLSDKTADALTSRGFDLVGVDMSQFHLGGGSVRCLTNPLDIKIGRDLTTLI